jgi:RNA polymerase sigma-70 factor (ECF subfamily)
VDRVNDQDPDLRADFDRAWREHRRHLLDIGFRMLGDVGEAEDAVQEAFARLVRMGPAATDIDDVGGWLVVVVSRVCIDRLRSGQRHPTAPEASFDDRPVTPTGGPLDPADRVTLDDSVGIALRLVLDRLSAAERTAFVLHDVFGYPFEAIAEAVGRTPAACRQLASRGRRTVRAAREAAGLGVEPPGHRELTARFVAACESGDLDQLLAVLDPEVTGKADRAIGRAGRPTRGARVAARGLIANLGPRTAITLLALPAGPDPVIAALVDGRLTYLLTLTVRAGRVSHIDVIADPVTLAPLAATLGA